MRLFRGYKTSTDEWVEGNFANMRGRHAIISPFCVPETPNPMFVAAASVGQFTGLFDADGKKIFEGDILHHRWDMGDGEMLETVSVVKWSEQIAAFICDDGKRDDWQLCLHVNGNWAEVRVIGNVFETPEKPDIKQNIPQEETT